MEATTMMHQRNQFLTRSLQINNEGVQHLMDCDNDAALRSFSTSLSNIRELIMLLEQEEPLTETNAAGPDSASSSSAVDNSTATAATATAIVPHLNLVQLSPAPISGLNGENEQFFAFQHGLNFPSSLLLLSSSATTSATVANGHSSCLHLYSASIMLNIALVFHRRGKMGPSNSDLLRAEAIYQKAIQCCAEAGGYVLLGGLYNNQGQTMPTSSVTLLVHVAAVNNLALLYQDMDRSSSINKNMEFLEQLLESQRMRFLPLLDDNTLQELYLNILLSGRIQEYDPASPAA